MSFVIAVMLAWELKTVGVSGFVEGEGSEYCLFDGWMLESRFHPYEGREEFSLSRDVGGHTCFRDRWAEEYVNLHAYIVCTGR